MKGAIAEALGLLYLQDEHPTWVVEQWRCVDCPDWKKGSGHLDLTCRLSDGTICCVVECKGQTPESKGELSGPAICLLGKGPNGLILDLQRSNEVEAEWGGYALPIEKAELTNKITRTLVNDASSWGNGVACFTTPEECSIPPEQLRRCEKELSRRYEEWLAKRVADGD